VYKEQFLFHEWDFLHREGASRDELLNQHSARLLEASIPGLSSHELAARSPGPKVRRTKSLYTDRNFEPGVYEFPFDLPMPSTYPESIELPLGKTYYSLTASVAQTDSPSRHISSTRTVNLVRIPSAGSLEQIEPYGVHGLQYGLRYHMMLHGKSFRTGAQVPLSIRIEPQADRSWHRLRISLLEEVQYRTRNGLAQREQAGSKAILMEKTAESRNCHLPCSSLKRTSTAGERIAIAHAGSAHIEKPRLWPAVREEEFRGLDDKLIFQLPTCSSIHADTTYSCLYVRHLLLITIFASVQLTDNTRRNFELRLNLPIQILTCKANEANTTLPKYSEQPPLCLNEHESSQVRCAGRSTSSASQCASGADDVFGDKARARTDIDPPSYENLTN